ncbi:hypothetical protein [Mycobacteroides salmoniphilum]|uniref:Knr4/Smi1-like domain-containing protein n=1 Tax=Mycobacteroides salmoniphilum TaxID=404941 RepID=A0A4R8SYB6_9MYCO|nr:hypothetical protein [Mycobacteroides salmoniphilum]TDZ89807.1 hypothetical protein CCUG62472_04745 [Mycobacteroides salmoniphilum]TEA07981.1 hypothetical protein CCUG60884_00459 [Mycobacteroides salmoniphilum]
MAAFDELVALVRPPDLWRFAIDWEAIESSIGARLPDDYRSIVDHYGWGGFYEDLAIWVPPTLSVPEHGDITIQGPWARDSLAGLRASIPASDVWVFPDGTSAPVDLGDDANIPFLGWGANSGGCYGYWHMIGPDPNTWPVVYTNLGGNWDYHPGGLAEYLLAKLSNTYPENTDDYRNRQEQDGGDVHAEPLYGEPYFAMWTE